MNYENSSKMYKRLILILALALLLATILFMVYDFFFSRSLPEKNPYEFNIDAFKQTDSTLVAWTEVQQIRPETDSIKSVAVDLQDNIYIGSMSKLFIYSKEGHLKNSVETGGVVYCLHVDASGKIYLGMNDHIEIMNRSGRQLQRWNAVNEKSVLTSITTSDSFVFVADAGNRVVYKYDNQGNMLKKIGEKDPDKGIQGFVIPSPHFDLLLGRDGELWVVNPGRHQLEAYDMSGNQISSWQKTSMQLDGFCGCCNPSNIAMLSDGAFVTSEKAIVRVKIHQPDGEFREVVASPEAFDEGTVGLDLTVDSQDRIVLLDPERNMVRIFVRKSN
jgi:sugar lactone lactonase YvrE